MSDEIDKFKILYPGVTCSLVWGEIKKIKNAFFKTEDISGSEKINLEECKIAMKSLKQSLTETEEEGRCLIS